MEEAAAAAAVADINKTTSATMVAEFVISCALKLAALLLFLQIHLIKLCAVITNGLCAHLLSLLNQILPPGSKFDSIHHYMNELEVLAKAKLDRFVTEVYEIYPEVKQYIQIKLEESIAYMEAISQDRESIIHSIHHCLTEIETLAKTILDYLVAKYCEIYPVVKRFTLLKLEDTIRYMEARKQEFASNKSEEHLIVRLVSANPVATVCVTVAIGFVFIRLCGCGRRSKMMKAPGRGGAKMRRRDFESNPKNYFTGLHSRSQR